MLHPLRSVLVRPGRERLQGSVEVDETYIGGEELGLRGGRAKAKKLLLTVAVNGAILVVSGVVAWRSCLLAAQPRCARCSSITCERARL